MSQKPIYAVELAATKDGGGPFSCPGCGREIDPNNDKTFKVYEVKTEKNTLKSLILGCNNCEGKIELRGL